MALNIRAREARFVRVPEYHRLVVKVAVPTDALIIAVRRWWIDRLHDGCQLTDIWTYRPMFDYRGEGRWKRKVAAAALYNDFMRSRWKNEMLTFHRFTMIFNSIAPLHKVRTETGRMESRGKLFLRPRRRYYVFHDLEFYKERTLYRG